MLEGAESEGCWRVQNPSSIKEKPKVGQLKMHNDIYNEILLVQAFNLPPSSPAMPTEAFTQPAREAFTQP